MNFANAGLQESGPRTDLDFEYNAGLQESGPREGLVVFARCWSAGMLGWGLIVPVTWTFVGRMHAVMKANPIKSREEWGSALWVAK